MPLTVTVESFQTVAFANVLAAIGVARGIVSVGLCELVSYFAGAFAVHFGTGR